MITTVVLLLKAKKSHNSQRKEGVKLAKDIKKLVSTCIQDIFLNLK